MIWVTAAEYDTAYKIKIQFNDNTEKLVDLQQTIRQDHRSIIRELENYELFRSFSVDLDTIVWKNGADFAPEFLYSL